MSEKQHFNVETLAERSEDVKETHEHKITAVEHAHAEKKKEEALNQARHEATVESLDKQKVLKKIEGLERQTDDNVSDHLVNTDLKKSTYQKEIKNIRRKLTTSQKVASKVIHQPVVRNVSEVSSKTITRPSGLLGGGLIAFLGTSVYLYLTKYIGLKYNYSIFLILLALGFVVGIVLELLVRVSRTRRSA